MSWDVAVASSEVPVTEGGGGAIDIAQRWRRRGGGSKRSGRVVKVKRDEAVSIFRGLRDQQNPLLDAIYASEYPVRGREQGRATLNIVLSLRP